MNVGDMTAECNWCGRDVESLTVMYQPHIGNIVNSGFICLFQFSFMIPYLVYGTLFFRLIVFYVFVVDMLVCTSIFCESSFGRQQYCGV